MKRAWLVCLLALLAVLSVCATSGPSMAQEKLTLRVTNWFPVGHQQNTLLQEWCKDLEKRTNGRVKVNYFAGGTLVPAAQTYDAVVRGIADVGNHVLGYTMGRFPFSQVLDLPIGVPPGPAATRVANQMYNKFKPKEFDEVKVLWFHGQPGGYLATKTKPVSKLEDVKGLKLRCYGSNAKFVGLIGATPVAMPMPDVYDALARGVVDGLLSSYEALEGFRTGEHIKYVTENLSTAYSATFLVAMNKKKFASLPADIRDIIDKMSAEYIEKYAKMWTDIDVSGKDWLLKKGTNIITLTKEEDRRWYEKGTKPLVDEYIKEMKAKGMPGDEAVKFLLDSFAQARQ